MKAIVLRGFGMPLSLQDVNDPAIGTGEVLVDVVAAPVLPCADEVFSGPGATCCLPRWFQAAA